MGLEKKVIIDSIEVLEDGIIQIRQATKVLEDGKEIGKTYHRWCKAPDEDVTNEDDRVKSIANAIWTQEVKDNYIAKKMRRQYD